jgi:Domain of unknown function (DUF397)
MTARARRRGHQSGAETEASWVKSSLSYANGSCVQVANLPEGIVGVRDSKDTKGPILRFTPDEWQAFVGGVQNGEFDQFGNIPG